MDEERPSFSAMVVDEDTIEAVGSKDELAAVYPEGLIRVMDLGGKTVLPGFIDTHQHLEWTGQVLGSADLTGCADFADVFDNIRVQRETVGKGEWVLAYRFSDQRMAENRMPLAVELDKVCADAPVAVVHACLHFLSLNTMAVQTLGIKTEMNGVDTAGGRVTGVVRDPASLTIVMPQIDRMIPKDAVVKGYDRAARMALKNGITSLHCLEGKDGEPESSAFFHRHHKDLPLHIVHWNQNRDVQSSLDLGLPRIGGCIFADGAIDCYTAALFEEHDRGRLKPGMKAEFIVLDRNPYEVDPEDICNINIEQVFAKGKHHHTQDL